MAKKIKVYPTFFPSDVIRDNISKSDKEKILFEWFRHFNEYFTPVAQDHAEYILENTSNDQHRLEIIKSAFWHNPELFHSEMTKDMKYLKFMYGTRVDVSPKEYQYDIAIYSKKLSSDFVSSQELIRPVIEHLCRKYKTAIIAPKSSPPDEFYKDICSTTILIETKKEPEKISNEIGEKLARVIVNLDTTVENRWLLYMRNSYLVSIWGSEPGGARIPDGIILCRSIPNSYINDLFDSKRRLNWVECTNPAPIETNKRKYTSEFIDKKVLGRSDTILFGAFCRLTKLNTSLLKVWAYALRYFPNSRLGFSYIQVNNISEYYVKKFFEKEGINPDRVFFYARTDTNTYLERLKNIDIMFGASPEEGGITFTDSVCQGIPFITYNAKSTSITSSNALTKMGYPEWCVRSAVEFVQIITEELRSTYKRSGKRQAEMKERMLKRSVEVRQKYIAAIDQIIDDYLR